jgi:hypothetical protein
MAERDSRRPATIDGEYDLRLLIAFSSLTGFKKSSDKKTR